MLKTLKVYLYPTKKQENKMLTFCHTSRFVYNWALTKKREMYEKEGVTLKLQDLITDLQILKSEEKYMWLKDTAEAVTKQAIKDLFIAYTNFFKQGRGYPRYKSRKRAKLSFYQRTDKLKIYGNTIVITGIGRVKIKKCTKLPSKPKNPRVLFDGKYWYLSLAYELEEHKVELTEKIIGIDIGIKDLAIRSDGVVVPNINKTSKVKKLEKKLKRLKRKVSNKYEENKKRGGSYNKSKNIIKVEKRIRLIHRRLNNIRVNHLHNATSAIVKTKPCRVVVEDLNISGMMKNRNLARAIANQGLYRFQIFLEYKCNFDNIEFIKADRWFPSSKLCSCCGNKKTKLSLSERIYICDVCGMIKDRDLNSAINLSKYAIV
ncbi:putative transposase [compost metagenome]